MPTRKLILGSVVAGVVVIGWYLFRPELLFISTTVNEGLPGSAVTTTSPAASPATVLVTGEFHSVAHATMGQATIHRLADGKRIVRFTEFETSNGPDVRVYLVAADDASDNETVTREGFIDLGALKGTQGNQNYDIPDHLDLEKYRAVTVWCRRFGVNFATAPLMPQNQI
jgi:hypothetical protein